MREVKLKHAASEAYREKRLAYDRSPARRRRQREARLRANYDLTPIEFDLLLALQGGSCAICGTGEPGGISRQWAIDHNHLTNRVRGILCHKCNRGIGHFNDDIGLLRAASSYLEAHA